MKRETLVYRGINKKLLQDYQKKGIPKGTIFTTDPFMAKKHGDNLIGVYYSKNSFIPTKDNSIFQKLRINERYYITKYQRKRFIRVGMLK